MNDFQEKQTQKELHSRAHRLKSFDTPACQCYVKRDDELQFGSKTRKYHSLLPYIIREKFQEVVLIGGANSNHILAMTQLLLANQITPTLFLRKGFNSNNQGNSSWINQLVDVSAIHWISRQDWSNVETIVSHYIQERKNSLIISEGGANFEAFSGALSLANDIINNERELHTHFDHIFIDAGTGFTAIAALLGMLSYESQHHFHILLLADDRNTFVSKLRAWHQQLISDRPLPNNFTLYLPTNARSFGSVNRKLLNEIAQIHQDEKILLEPIYSGKLFFETRRILTEKALVGNVLLIHSGLGVRMKQEIL